MNVYDLIASLLRYNSDATVDVYATGIPGSGPVDLDIDGVFGAEDAATIHAYVSDLANRPTHGHGAATPPRTSATPPRHPATPTHRKTALDELDLHCARYGDRHIDVGAVHALLEIGEQLRLANLIALAQVQLPPENVDADDLVYVRNQAASTLIHLENQECRRADGDLDVVELLALRPDVAAALGIEPLDEQEQQ